MPTNKAIAEPTPQVTAATWVSIRDRRLLVVRPTGQTAFYLPGGTPEAGETLIDATVREVIEETGIHLRPETLVPFTEVTMPAYDRPGINVRLVCFTAESDAEPAAAAEIEAVAWITTADKHRCAPAVQRVVDLLAADDLIR